ncbi:MAG TPA: hypothetical protein VKG02_21010 [Blastocatellia bacterium]|nr:hypothetical protein [Blastocatellia bacterium]
MDKVDPQEFNNDCLPAVLAGHVLTLPGAAAKSPRSGARVSPHAGDKVSPDIFPRACAKIPPHYSIEIRIHTFRASAPRIEAAAD